MSEVPVGQSVGVGEVQGGNPRGSPLRLIIERQIGLLTPRGFMPAAVPYFRVIEELTMGVTVNITSEQLVEVVSKWATP